ncbi:hypothetical protein KC332_g2044 [Hortaea werneckii]|nr:hypothetical protein KC350_g5852 [Hortaea werneckii]KAI6848015.1 hypothetical protein KC358_g2024 [Hortaea werneckii]KAI6942673.1 hypothetical protein KC341_g2066 [Hortaea werneckii]KAI6948476.1 hypothetical protein KC348_g1901 [Hortaea werneckii]KAI6980518.1 hypothetical protein KC321_g1742 [Hortaea werneckii]
MTTPTNDRSSSPSPSSNLPSSGKEGQPNTPNPSPAAPSSQISQSDDYTASIVEGDWVVVAPSTVPGREAPGSLSDTSSKAHNSGLQITRADVEENLVGKLAALFAERGDAVQGDREVQELVEREFAASGVDLGIEREGDGEEDSGKLVDRRGE